MVVLSVPVVSFLLLHSFLPSATVDTTSLGLLALLVFIWILPIVKTIKLPGGTEIDLNSESIAEARRDLQKVNEIRIATSKQRVGSGAPAPELTWRGLLRSNVKMALTVLRAEIERKLLQVEEHNHLSQPGGFRTLLDMVETLRAGNVLAPEEARAVLSVVAVCDQAVHAESISSEAAQVAADLGESVLQILQSKLQ